MNINDLINSTKACAGQLWIAENDLIAEVHSIKTNGRKIYHNINKGEIVEFRFHGPAHFRTTDDIYFSCSYLDFFSNFNLYGKIWDNIRYENNHSLEQILFANLYKLVGADL